MGSTVEPLVRYSRTGGRLPPRDRERLLVYPDGAFDMWRSISTASLPPSPVGQFRGQLPPALLAELQSHVASAARAGDMQVIPPPDAAIDCIQIPAAQATMGQHEEPEGSWGLLVSFLRSALGSLTDQPQAAVLLQVAPDGQSARLAHAGSAPLTLALNALSVRAVLWRGRKKEGDWYAPKDPGLPSDPITAQPGWVFDLPFGHGFSMQPEHVVAAYVTLTLYDAGQPVPVSLEARSQSV